MQSTLMNLKVLLPFQVFAEKEGIRRIVAETREGTIGFLPQMLDCVIAIRPGTLVCETESEGEFLLTVDEGVLIKHGSKVLVSVGRAIGGTDHGRLQDDLEEEFMPLEEGGRSMAAAKAR